MVGTNEGALAWEPASTPMLLMQDIVKAFPGVVANDHVTFEVRAGEVHALLGENGAGKTTLMNILYGLYRPDSGHIFIKGKEVHIRSPRDAIAHGIGMVHQHFKLVYPHTVAENVALGLSGTPFFRPARAVERGLVELSQRYGLPVDPKARVWQLSAGEQQRVEILKALYRGAEILILDEPTSVLTPQETAELFKVLSRMKEEGHAVIFITHKLSEVMEVADRVTVMRRGKVVDTLPVSQTDKVSLARMMVGREVVFRLSKGECSPGEEALVLEDVHVMGDRGLPALKGVSLRVCRGEILGVAGVAGNGQRELVEVVCGLRRVQSGRVIVLGKDLTNRSARRVADVGVAHIPEERLRMGIVPGMTVEDNLILKRHHRPPFSRGPFLKLREIRRFASRSIEEYEIMTPSLRTPAKLLSGGNIQKLILARELSGRPGLVVAAHPTYGLDVGATELIRQLLIRQRDSGAGVLLVSEDLDEIMSLSDRIAVMFGGEIMGILPAAEASLEEIGLMMAGERRKVGQGL
ncbi:MAG: ABC transporter ATP-binding protein [Acetothermia bacterium 64_32]|nr:MAG: ABC transporter ATP-binding protein [Acetothermia bacterium 64_32]